MALDVLIAKNPGLQACHFLRKLPQLYLPFLCSRKEAQPWREHRRNGHYTVACLTAGAERTAHRQRVDFNHRCLLCKPGGCGSGHKVMADLAPSSVSAGESGPHFDLQAAIASLYLFPLRKSQHPNFPFVTRQLSSEAHKSGSNPGYT